MKHLPVLFLAVALLILSPSLSAGTVYELDTSHSSITFSVKHMVISNVKGKFQDFTVKALYDEKDTSRSSVEAVIKVAGIDTDNDKRDDHLRSPDFLDAEKYPEITFKSKKIVKKGDDYVALGDFTMHGVTKEISLPFKILGPINDPWGGTRAGIEAGITLDRRNYGLTWNKALDAGGLVVGNEVEIEIDLEFIKAK